MHTTFHVTVTTTQLSQASTTNISKNPVTSTAYLGPQSTPSMTVPRLSTLTALDTLTQRQNQHTQPAMSQSNGTSANTPAEPGPRYTWIGFRFSRALTLRERRLLHIVIEDRHMLPVPDPAVKNAHAELWFYLGDTGGFDADQVCRGAMAWAAINVPDVDCQYNIL